MGEGILFIAEDMKSLMNGNYCDESFLFTHFLFFLFLLLLLLYAVVQVLFEQSLSELLVAVLANPCRKWSLLVLLVLLVFLLYPLDRTPEVLRLGLPVIGSFVELGLRLAKLRFFLDLVLTDDIGLSEG